MDYQTIRRRTYRVEAGNIAIGGNEPIRIQSMTNADPHNTQAVAKQVKALEDAGCEMVRITIPDMEAAETIPAIKKSGIHVPLVADIHFDYRIALRCCALGIDKIRINPGNIGDDDRVRQVAEACAARRIPIRIGVNSGSLEKSILAKYGAPTAEALCESALYHISLLEKYSFHDIIVSIKASDPYTMIAANRILAGKCNYPIHLGVTEAGGGESALIKSSIGIGALLCDGIGDTLRVSLTDDPVTEVAAARGIIDALHIKGQSGMDFVSCPTCGRTKIDLISLTRRVRDAAAVEGLDRLPLKVAMMGCIVNGPGEAREADVGIAGGDGEGLLFRGSNIIAKLPEAELIPALLNEIRKIAAERGLI